MDKEKEKSIYYDFMTFGTVLKKQIAYILYLKDLSFDMAQDCGEKRFAESAEKVWLTWPPNYKTFFLFHNRFQTDLCTCSRYVLAKDISWT